MPGNSWLLFCNFKFPCDLKYPSIPCYIDKTTMVYSIITIMIVVTITVQWKQGGISKMQKCDLINYFLLKTSYLECFVFVFLTKFKG